MTEVTIARNALHHAGRGINEMHDVRMAENDVSSPRNQRRERTAAIREKVDSCKRFALSFDDNKGIRRPTGSRRAADLDWLHACPRRVDRVM